MQTGISGVRRCHLLSGRGRRRLLGRPDFGFELENEDEDLDQDSVWHFFDNNGRMVVNQIDRKINGSYYTFQNGILQTGWFRHRRLHRPRTTAADADAGNATASNADIASNENNSDSAATQAAPAIASLPVL